MDHHDAPRTDEYFGGHPDQACAPRFGVTLAEGIAVAVEEAFAIRVAAVGLRQRAICSAVFLLRQTQDQIEVRVVGRRVERNHHAGPIPF